MSELYKQEKTTIEMPDKSRVEVDCGTGDAEGCLRNKVRIALIEARLKKIEEILGIK